MKIKLNTKSKYGQGLMLSTKEENEKLIKVDFLADVNRTAISISYEDGGIIVEIDDEFIID